MIADQSPVHLPPKYYDFLKQVLCHEKIELLKHEEEYDNLILCRDLDAIGQQLKVEHYTEKKSSNPKDYVPSFSVASYVDLTIENCYPLDLHIPWAFEENMKKLIKECRDEKFQVLKKLVVLKWQLTGRCAPMATEINI